MVPKKVAHSENHLHNFVITLMKIGAASCIFRRACNHDNSKVQRGIRIKFDIRLDTEKTVLRKKFIYYDIFDEMRNAYWSEHQ